MLKRKQQQERDEAICANLGDDVADDAEELSTSGESESEIDKDEGGKVEAEQETPAHHSSFKVKLMLLGSRGIGSRHRHLLNDFHLILPHSKYESKFNDKSTLFMLNELAELNNCTHALFLESRKPDDIYLWLAKCPSGPSVRFHVENIHTLDELAFAGNCMLGTRPILSFDSSLSKTEHGLKMQELLISVFGTPESCRKARPYHDHVFLFSVVDGRIWFRNYQIVDAKDELEKIDGMSLVEIGPRFVLNPVRLFAGSFGGQTLWKNENFQSGAELRAVARRSKAGSHMKRVIAHDSTVLRNTNAQIERSEIDKVFDN